MRTGGVGAVSSISRDLEVSRASSETGANRQLQSQPETEKRQSGADLNASQLTQAELNLLPVSEKTILEAIERANNSYTGVNTRFEFSIHEKTKQIMVKVIDEQSNEVIRQIPPEKILDIIAGIWETAGLFVDERR